MFGLRIVSLMLLSFVGAVTLADGASLTDGWHEGLAPQVLSHVTEVKAYTTASPRPVAFAPIYEIVNGEASTTHGFGNRGELWVQNGRDVVRLFASDSVVVYENGTTAKYTDVQKELQEEVRANGPRPVQVHKFAGGTAFAQVRLLPRRKR